MVKPFTLSKSSCLGEGVHDSCELTKVGEVDGQYGRQFWCDFLATSGPNTGAAIRAYAGLESESGDIVPSMDNKIGRLLVGLAGLDAIDDDVEVDVEKLIGSKYVVTVDLNSKGKAVVDKVELAEKIIPF